MPGGVSVALLILQAANAVTGAAAIDYIRDAGMKKDMAYSQFAITDEQMQLVKECNVNVTDFNYLVAVISGLFSIADFADCARILKELGYFDDITKTLLRNGKNVSAKLLKKLPKEDVQKLAHACEKINPELFNRVAELPENEVSKLLASSDLDGMLKKIDSLSDSFVENLGKSGRLEDLRFLPDDIKIENDSIRVIDGSTKGVENKIQRIPVSYYLDIRKATDISTLEQLAKSSGTEQKVINKARELGWSEKEFYESFQNYLSGQFSGTVGNCLTKAEDMSDCKTYMDYLNKLGLDYTYKDGTPGPFRNGEKMYVMRYTSSDTESLVIRSYGGVNKSEARKSRKTYKVDQYKSFIEDRPYTGTGWTLDHGGGLGKPEFHTIREKENGKLVSTFCEIKDGSSIYEVSRDGEEKLVAIRLADKWIEVK